MKRINSVVRSDKVDDIRQALSRLNVFGIATTDVKDYSPQAHPTGFWRGQPYCLGFTPKVELEMVVHDDDVDCVVRTIICLARTGRAGDGHVSVMPVEHRYEIRTGVRDVS
jgi:nitrogen regulatory protein P-II 1